MAHKTSSTPGFAWLLLSPRAGILRSSELDSVGLDNEAENRHTDSPGTGRKYVSWWGHLHPGAEL